MELWIANDLNQSFSGHQLRWTVRAGGKVLLQGEKTVDISPISAVQVNTVSLADEFGKSERITVSTSLHNTEGAEISRYSQEFHLTAWRKNKEPHE